MRRILHLGMHSLAASSLGASRGAVTLPGAGSASSMAVTSRPPSCPAAKPFLFLFAHPGPARACTCAAACGTLKVCRRERFKFGPGCLRAGNGVNYHIAKKTLLEPRRVPIALAWPSCREPAPRPETPSSLVSPSALPHQAPRRQRATHSARCLIPGPHVPRMYWAHGDLKRDCLPCHGGLTRCWAPFVS